MLGRRPDEEEKVGSPPPASSTVIPTLVALGKGSPTINPYTQFQPAPLPDSHWLALELEIQEALIKHYYHWAQLAKGSWSELSHLAAVINNCQALQKQIDSALPDSPSTGLSPLLQRTIETLIKLQTRGPQCTYFLCNAVLSSSAPEQKSKINAELQDIAQQTVSLAHLSNYTLCQVASGEAAFTLGTRASDNSYISEAYLSSTLQNDTDKLRDFVYKHLETFHANPKCLGQKIRFQGNFTKEYLHAAIHYCNLRGYAWEIDDHLKNKVLSSKASDNDRALFNKAWQDRIAMAEWQDWLLKKEIYPFANLLDHKTLKSYETRLNAPPLNAAEKSEALKNLNAWLNRPSGAPEKSCETKITPDPADASLAIDATSTRIEKDGKGTEEPSASLTHKPGAI